MPVSIVVADDNAAFRRVLEDVLGSSPGINVLAAADGGESLLVALADRPNAVDVVVMDVDMPGGGPALAAEVARRHPSTRILCLSARDDADTVLSMLAAGATGYIAKGGLDEDLASCVRRCASGVLFVIATCAPEVRRLIAALLGRTQPTS